MLPTKFGHRNQPRLVAFLGFLIIISLIVPPIAPISNVALASEPVIEEEYWMENELPAQTISDEGLQMELQEGFEQPEAVEQPPIAESTPLTEEETQQLLDRLPPLTLDESDQVQFRLPPESPPAPRTGDTIEEVFPVDEESALPEPVESGPLRVLRYAPEGEIPMAPFLNITFNQPMVPLGTLENLSALDVPVTLTPELPGVWKWIGTQTLTFEYDGENSERFPMATRYVAEVPAGTESATGGVLQEDVSWTFSTPAPRVLRSVPSHGPQARDPLMFVEFDQQIDPEAVLRTITVTAGGSTYIVRLATEEEIAADKRIARLAEVSPEGRWLAFKSEEIFPADTTVVVNIGPETPSAEGPLVTSEVQSYSFQTYAALRIENHRCGYYDESRDCPPLSPFEILFNNPLDEEAFDESLIQVTPEIPGQIIEVFGRTIRIRGVTAGRTTYTVSVDGSIRDIFGQELGADADLTFETGSAPEVLIGPRDELITVDPTLTTPNYTFYSINYDRLRVRIFTVTPDDWSDYLTTVQQYRWDESRFDPPGQEVVSRLITIDSEPDVMVETSLDLSEALDGEYGHLIVVVDQPKRFSLRRDRINGDFLQAWVQVTQIGLDAFVDHTEMTAWATSLLDGEPLSDVELTLSDQPAVRTNENGLAVIPLPSQTAPILTAEKGNDTALLPPSEHLWSSYGWERMRLNDSLRWHVFDDRGMYKPGEEVHLKGWVRKIGSKQDAEVELLPGAWSVQYQVLGSRGNELANGVADVNDLGGFDLAFTLPENANLGYAQVYLSITTSADVHGTNYYHGFQIQEFRRPEFEVSASVDDEGPVFIGEDATVSVQASYYAGGPLPNAQTNWSVTASPSTYSPPNWQDFTFGIWKPWWGYFGDRFGDEITFAQFEGRTDAAGVHYLNIEFLSASEARPYSVMADVSVMDVNRQAWASSASLLVHPAELYVGLRSDRTFVESGEPLIIEAIVTDIDGAPIEDRAINMTAVRLEWKFENGEWVEKEVDPQTCTVGSQLEPVSCEFGTELGGEYQITATITDSQGRENLSQFTRWVSGGQRPPSRRVEREEVLLIPNKESYQPGEVAEILVQSPFTPAEGLFTLRRNGIVSTETFEMEDSTYTLQVPILDEHIPNIYVSVDLAGSAVRYNDEGEVMNELPRRPAYASGTLNLIVPPLSRELSLTVEPAAKELQPGEQTELEVVVTDAAGNPVENAELAVVVVDEAILALTNYMQMNPLDTFYQQMGDGVSSYYGRSSIVLANPEDLAENVAEQSQKATDELLMRSAGAAMPSAAAPTAIMEEAAMDMAMEAEEGLGAGPPDDQQAAIAVRTDFNPLAVFAPSVRTDADGKATIEIELPDNLTRYRVMVSAVAGAKYFGSGESAITARLPLMVRPSAPRFLNFGDQFELPIVIQNQTDDTLTVNVAVRAGNLDLGDGLGQQIEIPANDRREVRFPASTDRAGTTRLQIAAASEEFADAATVELPVYTPATTEAFATYGVIDDGAISQPVLSPTGVFTQFGGLEISTSSTALQALTDAVLYLVAYPFECSEQLASRILGIASLRDVLTAFDAAGLPAPDELNDAVYRDIARLQQMQNWDGGFPIWRRGDTSVPFYSIHAAHALQRAVDKGYEVPEEMLARSLDHLRDIESYYPSWYGEMTRHSLSAYALYVRDLMGDVDTQKARRLLSSYPLDEQSLEAVAWLWQVLADDPASTKEVDAIRQHINNRAVETPGAANFFTGYGDEDYVMLHSDRRTDAIILDALINDQPDSDLIPKVVNGLLAHRTKGRWSNTQENVFVLIALDRYFNTFESQTPDFVARMWLGDTYVAGHEFEGYNTDTRTTTVPMAYVVDAPAEDGLIDLILQKDGEGRLYYRLGMHYAPDDLELEPLDMGFTVQRRYEAVDDPDDVSQDADGTWRIKAGARVRVRVDMVANTRRYHVALVDPLPAGLESINPALAVSERTPDDGSEAIEPYTRWWWWGPWYQHQNLRDARAEAFTTLLWEGVYEYSYVARATTPGDYVVPPAKAEEMYSPEVFGRSASDRVIIE